jgi:hypothetical protein
VEAQREKKMKTGIYKDTMKKGSHALLPLFIPSCRLNKFFLRASAVSSNFTPTSTNQN